MTATSAGRLVEPPLTGNAGGTWHAVGWIWPANPRYAGTVRGLAHGVALCGVWADPVRRFGAFDPHRWTESLCHTCGWLHALRSATAGAWLARLGAEPGRGLPVAVAEAVLTGARRDWDTEDCDLEDVVDLLAGVSAHAGAPLIAPDCAMGGCDHRPGRCPTAGLACHACSLPDPHEDHRYRAEATVVAPCSTLRALAVAYGIAVDDSAEIAEAQATTVHTDHDRRELSDGPACSLGRTGGLL